MRGSTLPTRKRRTLILAAVLAASASVALFVGAVRLRTGLLEKVEKLDPSALLLESGLGIRTASFGWEQSDFRWFPRPTLVLRGLKGRFHSGRPGPGQFSARLEADELRIVSAWWRLFRGRVEWVELRGGSLECAPDILPSLPVFYNDPLDGSIRPIPWAELLDTLTDSLSVPSGPGVMERPAMLVRDMDLRLLNWELFDGYDFHLTEARAVRSDEGFDLRVLLSSRRPDHGAGTLPVRIRVAGEAVRLIEAGRRAGVPALVLETGDDGSWSFELGSERGSLVQAVLKGREGLAGRTEWAGGSWKIEASGSGGTLAGFHNARLALGPGRVRLVGGTDAPEAGVRGSLYIEPDAIRSPELWLWSTAEPADSARVEFDVRTTASGVGARAGVEGRLGLQLLHALGSGWGGRGVAQGEMRLAGRRDLDGGAWQLRPEGSFTGEYASLRVPWLDQPLSDGSFRVRAQEGIWDLAIDGRMGTGAFELRVDDLARRLPGAGLWSDAASRWSFRSSGGKLEDFAVSSGRAAGFAGIPFWVALPGQGSASLVAGSLYGVPVDGLYVAMRRTLRSIDVDTLDIRMAGGRVHGSGQSPGASADRTARKTAADMRLFADSLDLAQLMPAFSARGVDSHGLVRGRLSGRMDLRWTPEFEWENADLLVSGSLRVEDGEVRGHPVIDDLRSWTGLDGLRSLSFRSGDVRFVRGGDGVFLWDDLVIDSDLLRLEGAGTVSGGDTLWAVLRAEAGSGSAWSDLLRSVLKPGTAVHLWIEGPSELPEVRVIGSGAYREARERVRNLFTGESGRRQPSGSYR